MVLLLDSLTAPSAAKRRRAIASEEDQYLDVLHPDDLVLGFHFLEGVTHDSNAVTAWAAFNDPTAIMVEGAGGSTRRPTLGADGIAWDGGDELLLNAAGTAIFNAAFEGTDVISVVYIGTGDTRNLTVTGYYVRCGSGTGIHYIGKLSNEDIRVHDERDSDQCFATNGADEVVDYGVRALVGVRNATTKLLHLGVEYAGELIGDTAIEDVNDDTISFGSAGNQNGFIAANYKAVLFYKRAITLAESSELALIVDDTPGV